MATEYEQYPNGLTGEQPIPESMPAPLPGQPAPAPSEDYNKGRTRHRIANAAMGFVAGLGGSGPQYLERLDKNRQNAMIKDMVQVDVALDDGRVGDAREMLLDRLKEIKRLGGNPRHTIQMLESLDRGEVDGAKKYVKAGLNEAVRRGLLEPPERGSTHFSPDTGQVLTVSPEGVAGKPQKVEGWEQPVKDPGTQIDPKTGYVYITEPKTGRTRVEKAEGWVESPLEKAERQREQDRIDLQQQQEDRLMRTPSAYTERILEAAGKDARKARLLADESESIISGLAEESAAQQKEGGLPGGLKVSFLGAVRKHTGMQGEEDVLRNRFNRIRFSNIGKMLKDFRPVTDIDMQRALETAPPNNASEEIMTSYLRGIQKLAILDAEYNEALADYITEDPRRGQLGFDRLWRGRMQERFGPKGEGGGVGGSAADTPTPAPTTQTAAPTDAPLSPQEQAELEALRARFPSARGP